MDNSSTSLGTFARYFAEIKWEILPCHGINKEGTCTCGGSHSDPKDMGKHPVISKWNTEATSDPNQIDLWWERDGSYNIGVFCRKSGFFVIDIDPRSGGFESFEQFEKLVEGFLPPTVEAVTGVYSHNGREVRGRHLYYRVDENEVLIGNLRDAKLPGIDIKHNGYVLVPPSRHVSGVSYEWKKGHAPWEITMADAPEELLAPLRKKSSKRTGGSSVSSSDWGFFDGLEFRGEKLDVDKLLTEGIDEGARAVELYRLACSLGNKYGTDAEGRFFVETLMIRFNAEKVRPPLEMDGPGGLLSHVHRALDFVADNPKTSSRWGEVEEWQKDAARRISQGVFRVGGTEVVSTSDPDDIDKEYDIYTAPGTIGAAVASAAYAGRSSREASSLTNVDVPKDRDALTEQEGGDPSKRTLTDVGNGRRLVDSYQPVIRYTPGLGWFNWSGQHWENDVEHLNLRELTKQMGASIASEVSEYDEKERTDVLKWANLAKSTARIDAAIKNANSDPRISVRVDEWDSDPYLLGVANGVVDLRTSELLKFRPDLHITKKTPISYTPGIQSLRFKNFMDFATNGDVEFQEWLQRAVGYTFTGLNNLDVMFLVYGTPGSGKNTFVEAFIKALGTKQYAWPMDSSILAQNDMSSSSTDLYHWAELRGKRAVWFDELPDGERIKENSVKKLTGSSEISARSPGERPFTFQAQAKMWITTNHRPIITDDAMWRRIRPIPWMRAPETSDPTLKKYLFDPEGGLPAVLSWAVEGAYKYLNSTEMDGLGTCAVVEKASEMYRKSEDRLGMFFEDDMNKLDGGSVPIKSVYTVYRMWSEVRGEKPVSQIRFIRMLRDRGVEVTGESGGADVLGYTLKTKTATANADIDWTVLGRFAQ